MLQVTGSAADALDECISYVTHSNGPASGSAFSINNHWIEVCVAGRSSSAMSAARTSFFYRCQSL